MGIKIDIWASLNQAYRYTGKPVDEEKGIDQQYFGARYYQPSLGRWPAVDPLHAEYPGLSPYVYCADNPLKNVDPNGEFVNFVIGGAVGGGLEIASQMITDMAVNDASLGEAFDNVDWTDVGIATGVGVATSGLSAIKGVGTVAKAVITIAGNAAGNVAEGAAKANLGSKQGNYSVSNAVADAYVGFGVGILGAAGKGFAQTTDKAKQLGHTANKLTNIAQSGRLRMSQTARAMAASKKAQDYGSGSFADFYQQVGSTVGQEAVKDEAQ